VAGPDQRNSWIRIQPLRILPEGNDFGTIDHTAVTLSVEWRGGGGGDGANDLSVSLEYYDPVWIVSQIVAYPERHRGKDDLFVFRDLPVGKYQLAGFRKGKLGVREVVEITGRTKTQSVTVDSPAGMASIHGAINRALCGPGGCNGMQLRSKDNRLMGNLDVQFDGKFQFGGLPAGDYFLTQQGIRNADALAVFSVAKGEAKSISVSDKLLGWRQLPSGYLQVRPYTTDGVPLPGCQVTLNGPHGAVPRNATQFGQVTFISEPGAYELAVFYPGFKPVARHVAMKSLQGGPWTHDDVLNLTLERIGH
jgi:hypothetical protein